VNTLTENKNRSFSLKVVYFSVQLCNTIIIFIIQISGRFTVLNAGVLKPRFLLSMFTLTTGTPLFSSFKNRFFAGQD